MAQDSTGDRSLNTACTICGKPVPGDKAAVASWSHEGRIRWNYEPFLEDLRTTAYRQGFIHPVCFADTYGVEALVELIHEPDVKVAGRHAKDEHGG